MNLDEIKHYMLVFVVALPRILACFSIMAFFGRKVMGGLIIRNGVVFGLTLFLVPILDPLFRLNDPSPLMLIAIGFKEAAIGFLIGFVLNIPFLTIESIGSVIDNQRGATIMSSMNFLSGSEASALGILFSQGAVVLFLISGAFTLFLKGFYQSYTLWGIMDFWPQMSLSATSYFGEQFALIMNITILLSAPIVIALFLSEWGLALVNRFAPQLNVFFLSMSIKSAVAFLIIGLYFGTMLQHFETIFFDFENLSNQVLSIL